MDRGTAAVAAGTAVLAAQAIGSRSAPTPNHPRTALWYALLRKPAFTPPGPVFGIAWTLLDTLLGYSGYRLLTARPSVARQTALGLWGLNVLGVGSFSWVLFGRKRLDAATGVSGAMLASAIGAVAASAEVDRKAGLALLPLTAWLIFATLLQEEVWRRNR
jgi:tryptophan-rich sensory protein